MKNVKKVFSIIFWIVLVIVALYSIIIVVQKIFAKDKTPSFFGYKNFIVLTGSMSPELKIGDLVFVKDTDDIKRNDIISFRVNNSVVTHRVIEVLEEDGVLKYMTKGDANSGVDTEILTTEDIEGKYVFKIPLVGNLVMFLKTPAGIFSLLLIFGIILFVDSLKSQKNIKK